jgi:hypothetical protein
MTDTTAIEFRHYMSHALYIKSQYEEATISVSLGFASCLSTHESWNCKHYGDVQRENRCKTAPDIQHNAQQAP